MAFVLDASIAACWAFPDEVDALADAAFEMVRTDEAIVPALWWFEIRNVLVVSERRGRITPLQTESFLRDLALFAILIDRSPEESAVLGLARKHGLSVYDAAYLELARRESLALATLDSRLGKAARLEKVKIAGG